jgi:hypothetical protein
MEQYYKRKKQEQFFSFHDEATWTLAFGQVKCCLQTSLTKEVILGYTPRFTRFFFAIFKL